MLSVDDYVSVHLQAALRLRGFSVEYVEETRKVEIRRAGREGVSDHKAWVAWTSEATAPYWHFRAWYDDERGWEAGQHDGATIDRVVALILEER